MDPVVDRPLLNTNRVLPNSTIVLSMWFTILSNSFTVWDISFIVQKLLHSSMIPFPLNSGVIVHSTSKNIIMLARHPFSSLDIQSLVLSYFIILQ